MTEIIWMWVDRDGNEVDRAAEFMGKGDTDGRLVRDYFDLPLDELLEGNERVPSAVRSLLRASYMGPDCDGIGLDWIVDPEADEERA